MKLRALAASLAALAMTMAAADSRPSRKGKGTMTREEAVKAVQAVFRAAGRESPGLNEKGFGGLMLGRSQVFFEHQPSGKVLIVRAHIFNFPTPAEPGEIAGFQEEEKAGTPTGGGRVEYLPENKALFLTRTYDKPVDEKEFVPQVAQLAEASLAWRKDVFPRVMRRFHAAKKAAPQP